MRFVFKDNPFTAGEFPPDAQLDSPCAMTWFNDRKIKEADIGIVISFRPTILKWPKQEKVFMFITAQDPETKEIHWVAKGSKWLKRF